jgi:hypothetical protein
VHEPNGTSTSSDPPLNLPRDVRHVRGWRNGEDGFTLSSINLLCANEPPLNNSSLNTEQLTLLLQRDALLNSINDNRDIPIAGPPAMIERLRTIGPYPAPRAPGLRVA